MEAFARWLARHAPAVVVANVAVTVVLGLYAFHIRIENSLESMLPAGDPKVAYYNATRALFGSDDVGVIGVRADDVFAPSTILKIARVTDALARVPGVESVLSITNVVDPFANVGLTSRLLPHIPPTPDERSAFGVASQGVKCSSGTCSRSPARPSTRSGIGWSFGGRMRRNSA